jgi:outer membrane protein TolC
MMVKLAMFVLLTLCMLPHRVSAGVDSLLTLNDLIAEVRRENPELRAVRAELEAAGYRISWLRYLPEPVLAFEFSDNKTMYSVTQQIPFPTKISSRSERARFAFDRSTLLYVERELALIRVVKESYASFLLTRGKISTTKKSVVFLQQIYDAARQKYAVNDATQAEVLISQVELARAENQLMSFKDDLTVIKAYLNTLLNRDLDRDLPVLTLSPGQLDTLSLASLYDVAKQNQPKLKAFDLKRGEARLALSIARQTYLPDMTFRYTQEVMDNNLRNSKYMIGFTVPIWFLGKQNEMVREANSLVKSAGARYELMENSVLFDVKESRTRVEKHNRTVDFYKRSVLPQAETALKSAFTAYRLNKIDFQILLQSEKSLIGAEYDYEEAKAMLFMAVAELEQALGISD